jgi:hypothetical protein
MSSRLPTPSAAMAKAATPLDDLDQWLRGRADRQPVATNLSMLDGYVTAIVAGPVSLDPREWICPLLAIDVDAFNQGGTPEFAAISAVAVRHNDISNILPEAPARFEPSTVVSRTATSTHGPGTAASVLPCGCGYRLGRRFSTPTISITASSRPFSCTASTTRDVPSWTNQAGTRGQGVHAQGVHGHSGRRRSHAPIPDADPLPPGRVTIRHV